MTTLIVEQKVIESIFSNKGLTLLVYTSLSFIQIIYLKYYFNIWNLIIFFVNKFLTIYFIIFKLLFQQEEGALFYYLFFLLSFLIIMFIKRKQENLYREQRFFAEDSIVVMIAIFLVSFLDNLKI